MGSPEGPTLLIGALFVGEGLIVTHWRIHGPPRLPMMNGLRPALRREVRRGDG
jgi:hypothetical protein